MKYFKELENEYLNKTYAVYSLKESHLLTGFIPYEFYIKYQSVFTRINELYYHLGLVGIRERQKEIELIGDDEDTVHKKIHQLENEISDIMNKLLYTYGDVNDYMKEMSLHSFIHEYGSSLSKIEIDDCSYDNVKNTLILYRDLLEIVNISGDNLLEDINNAINDLNKLRTKIEYIKKTEKYSLPDCWYILPGTNGIGDHLFNTTGSGGHKDSTLEYLFQSIFWYKHKYHKGYENSWFNEAINLQKRDFVTHNEYDVVKMCRECFYSHFYDSTGMPYGLHEWFSLSTKSIIAQEIETGLESLVPKDKKDDYLRLFYEKSQYFNILDAHNLPVGLYELISKIIEYSKEKTFDINPFYTRRNKKILEEYRDNPFATKLINELPIVDAIYYVLCCIDKTAREEFEKDQLDYEHVLNYIYNQKAKYLVEGVYMAHGLVIKFFSDLYENVKDYDECINYLSNFDMDDILVKCCGFNKVVRQMKNGECYKVIITSNLNCEEEFKEYIDHGWKIIFIPPIRIDEYNKSLREMDDFCKVKRFHCKD